MGWVGEIRLAWSTYPVFRVTYQVAQALDGCRRSTCWESFARICEGARGGPGGEGWAAREKSHPACGSLWPFGEHRLDGRV